MKYLMVAVALLIAAPLGGCAGSVVGDAIAGPEVLAQRDDNYCRSIGLQFGTPDYALCRQNATIFRENHHVRMMGIAASAMAPPPTVVVVPRW